MDGAGMQNNSQWMVRPSFCVLPGGAQRNIGGLGEGNKGANLAEVPVKNDTALCAFVLLVIREEKKASFKTIFF